MRVDRVELVALEMAKAEESFPNWEQNWGARDKLELRRPEPGGAAETRRWQLQVGELVPGACTRVCKMGASNVVRE